MISHVSLAMNLGIWWLTVMISYRDKPMIDWIMLRWAALMLIVTMTGSVIIIGRWSAFDEIHPWVNAGLIAAGMWAFNRLSRPFLTAPMRALAILFLLYWTIVASDMRNLSRFTDPNGYLWMEMAAQIMAYWLVTSAVLALVNFTSGEWRGRRAALSSPHIGRGR